jgi:hypothetical protein
MTIEPVLSIQAQFQVRVGFRGGYAFTDKYRVVGRSTTAGGTSRDARYPVSSSGFLSLCSQLDASYASGRLGVPSRRADRAPWCAVSGAARERGTSAPRALDVQAF